MLTLRSIDLSGAVAVVVGLVAAAIALPASPAHAADNSFIDDDTSIFERSIEAVADADITVGCGDDVFCPTDPVTRGQMAAFVTRAWDLPASDDDRFVDDDGSVFEGAVQSLAAAGITAGCNPPSNDEFCPDETVTRGQMAAFLTRAMDLPASDDDRFVDDDGSVFEGAVQSLAAAGITAGCNPPSNDEFCPDETVTRGQMAAFLARARGLPLPEDPTPDAVALSRTLRRGDQGTDVVALQERLLSLGYWLPTVDGGFGRDTHHAVVALQKAAGIDRDGVVDAATRQALEEAVRPQPRSSSGTVIEVDRTSQLLLVVTDGKLRQVFDTSTGRDGYTTPAGSFRVERQIDGYRYAPLGTLYRPKYIYRGIAIHGYPSVPPSPASHGCVRVTNAAMDWLWANDVAPIGQPVLVH